MRSRICGIGGYVCAAFWSGWSGCYARARQRRRGVTSVEHHVLGGSDLAVSAGPEAFVDAFRNAFERSLEPRLLLDDAGRIAAVNIAARRRLGLQPASIGAQIDAVLPFAGGQTALWRALWEAADARDRHGAVARLTAGTCRATLIRHPAGGLHELAFADAEHVGDPRAVSFLAVADSAHDALISLDAEGIVRTVSARAELVLGAGEPSVIGQRLAALVPQSHGAELDAAVDRAFGGADVFQHDTKIRHRDGRVVDITVDLAPVYAPENQRIVGVSAIVLDITERKRLELLLRDQSERDPLTGLYNRRRFESALHQAVRLAQRHGQGGAVVLVDVDRFKQVNDTYGHQSGDRLLRELAGALTSSLRDSDLAARLGGDEFAVLLPSTDPRGASRVARKIAAAARAALREWSSGVSVGVASFGPGGILDPELALRAADQALYRAKATGGGALDVADDR